MRINITHSITRNFDANLSKAAQAFYDVVAVRDTAAKPSTRILNHGAIFGIVFAVLFVCAVIILLIYICFCRKRGKPSSSATTLSHTNATASPIGNPPQLPKYELQCLKFVSQEFLRSLKLKRAFFNETHDKCLCEKCYNTSMKNLNHNKFDTQLHGWVRFGLRINEAHQKQWKIFQEWKTSYYGTSPSLLSSILSSRFIPFDGDKLNDGKQFRSGHPNTNYCTTSPLLEYASRKTFTAHTNFRAKNRNNYIVQVVLQCRQKPGTYSVIRDPNSRSCIEWTTTTRCALIPYGILVRLKRDTHI